MKSTLRTRSLVPSLLLLCLILAPAASAQGTGISLSVALDEYQDSGVAGSAYLVETTNGGTHVSMELRGTTVEGGHPTHIHTGTCSDFNPEPLYPLDTVDLSPVDQQGVSDTDIPGVALSSLRGGEYVIVVHRSPEQLTEYLVCGDIGSATVGQAAKVTPAEGGAVAHHMPTAGIGPELGAAGESVRLAVLTALAVLCLGAAAIVRLATRR